MGKNVIIFGADRSSFAHIDNNYEDILILCEGLTQKLNGTTLTAEAKYPINFNPIDTNNILDIHRYLTKGCLGIMLGRSQDVPPRAFSGCPLKDLQNTQTYMSQIFV